MKIPFIDKIVNNIRQSAMVEGIIDWTRANSLPGFFEVPIYDVVVFIANELKRYDLMMRANAISFSFFLSLFPTIIVVFTMVPFFSDYILSLFGLTTEHFLEILQNEIRQILPGEKGVGNQLFESIKEVTTKPQADLLSLGFLLAMFFASNGMLSMMRGFEKAHLKTFKKRTGLQKRMIAVLLTIQLGVLALMSVLLVILGRLFVSWLAEYILINEFAAVGLYLLRWIIILIVFYFGIAIIYRYGVSVHRKLSLFSPGTTLATLLSILFSWIFSVYVDNYGAYNKLYGPIGTIIVVMVWIQLNSLVLLIGFELNASIAVHRDLKREIPDEEEITGPERNIK